MYELFLQIVIYVYFLKDVFEEEIEIEYLLFLLNKIFFILEEYGIRVINDIQNDIILLEEIRDIVFQFILVKKKILNKYFFVRKKMFINVLLCG